MVLMEGDVEDDVEGEEPVWLVVVVVMVVNRWSNHCSRRSMV
jgi:hypothetical protein